jgi:hypothetical protein
VWVGIALATGLVGVLVGLSIGQRPAASLGSRNAPTVERAPVAAQRAEEPRTDSADAVALVDEVPAVDPTVLRARTEALAKEPVELGALVRLFMLNDDEHAAWSMGASASSPVRWVTDGIAEVDAAISSQRIGYALIVVDGEPMTAVRRQLEELAWEVMLGSEVPPKFGPQFVSIRPDMGCFGSAGSGCDFELAGTLSSAGLVAHRLCANAAYGSGSEVYLLSADGRKPAWLEYTTSSGSAGTTNWVTVYWNEEDLDEDARECLRTRSADLTDAQAAASHAVEEVVSGDGTERTVDAESAPATVPVTTPNEEAAPLAEG